MIKKIVIQAPAKVNYRLDVTGKRSDGYHDLRMIMQRVNLCDEVSIEMVDEPGIRVVCGRDGVPDGEGNIAWKAAKSLLDLAESSSGLDISIVKNIPVAAGLGGGSSDCAAVLTGLNELLGLALSQERLMKIGVTLGADVPFFLFGQSALAEGIGDKLTALSSLPHTWIVLVNPNVPVSTAWVYKNLQLTGNVVVDTLPNYFENVASLCAVFSNDLESVTITAFPVIDEIKRHLLELGAAGSMMSGSGPTVFGVFESEQTARLAAESIQKQHKDWFVAAAETI